MACDPAWLPRQQAPNAGARRRYPTIQNIEAAQATITKTTATPTTAQSFQPMQSSDRQRSQQGRVRAAALDCDCSLARSRLLYQREHLEMQATTVPMAGSR